MWNYHSVGGPGRIRFRYLLLVIFLGLGTSYPQESVQSITVDVRLVNLNVAVQDKNGRAYPGLTVNSFRIYDNGVEQAIHHFSAEDLPYSMGVVLDRSGSMTVMIQDVYNAAFHTAFGHA